MHRDTSYAIYNRRLELASETPPSLIWSPFSAAPPSFPLDPILRDPPLSAYRLVAYHGSAGDPRKLIRVPYVHDPVVNSL